MKPVELAAVAYADVPEVTIQGKPARIRQLTLAQTITLNDVLAASDDKTAIPAADVAQVCAWALVNGSGERLYQDEESATLLEMNPQALMRIFNGVIKLTFEDFAGN